MMEHIDDILSSDLLERYVLGDVSPEEKMKVELLRIEHGVIRQNWMNSNGPWRRSPLIMRSRHQRLQGNVSLRA